MAYHLERDGMPLHDAVWANCEKGTTADIEALVPSMWAERCMLDKCTCVIYLK